MIMTRNEDGTYSQVGFVKDNGGIDTEYIYDKDGDIVFEKGFTRETSGTVPLTINGIGKDLKSWSITGNTVQNGTPTPDNPIMPQGTGEKTAQLFDYQTGTPTAYKYLDENGTEHEVSEIAPWYITDYIPIPDGVLSVTLSKIGGGSPAMCAYDASKNYITGIKYDAGSAVTKVDTTLTSSTPIRFIRFSYFLGNTGYDDISTKMLNAGSIPLPYEPYGYKISVVTSADGAESITTPIYLDSPLYKIGDYADRLSKTEEVRVVKELVLTGEEDIFYGDTYTRFRVNIADFETFGVRATPFYMSHYIVVSDGRPLPDVPDNAAYSGSSSDNHCIFIKTTNYTTVADFKSYLAAQYAAGTPVKVYYVMQTPKTKTVEPVEIPTINGTTVIDVDTAVKPTEMYTKYKSSK